jgi:hypothetical protein
VEARFSAPVLTALGPNLPIVKRVLSLFPRGKAAGAWPRYPPVASTRTKGKLISTPLLPLWVFTDCARLNFSCILTVVLHVDPLVVETSSDDDEILCYYTAI